ncbi:hypothetical protein BSKO_00683 [Bryopsis sp. KO-2023]|nr:hypothetical protein BSKO_00683 [Bryopsis sp. KO-2023]
MEGWKIDHLVLNGDDHSMVSTSDVVLEAGTQKFPVHSQIMSMKSSFFRRLLVDLGMGGPNDKTVVPLEGVDAQDLSKLLKLVYHEGEVLKSKEEMAGVWLLARTFDIPGIEKDMREVLNSKDWLMHCAGYPVGNLLTESHRRRAAKTPMHPGDESDAIRWLAIADKTDMGSIQTKCFTILLKFITSAMDHQKEAIARDEMDKRLSAGLVFDLARMAGSVGGGAAGVCKCGVQLSNDEVICYPCAKAIVEGSGSSNPGPSE